MVANAQQLPASHKPQVMLFPPSAPHKKERRRSSSSQSLLWVPEELENQVIPNVSWFLASRNYGMGSKTMPKREIDHEEEEVFFLPHEPWFLTGDTAPFWRQSMESGASISA
jgi:hypothetical protein